MHLKNAPPNLSIPFAAGGGGCSWPPDRTGFCPKSSKLSTASEADTAATEGPAPWPPPPAALTQKGVGAAETPPGVDIDLR